MIRRSTAILDKLCQPCLVGAAALCGVAMHGCDAGGIAPGAEGAGASSAPSGGGGAGAGSGATEPQGGEGGGFNPAPNPCVGHPGEVICEGDTAISCDANEQPESEEDCGAEVCLPGTGCVLCIEGQYSCEGNELRLCNVGPPPAWEAVDTCNPTSLERCSPAQGACVPLTIIGANTPTGTYYQYAYFTSSNSPFLGGYDVDCYGNTIYVNRGGTHLDVYRVDLLDSDGDGVFEPNQHTHSPDHPGPIEERVLTHLATYDVNLGKESQAELFAASDRVFFLDSQDMPQSYWGDIFEYVIGSGSISTAIDSATAIPFSQLAYDEVEQRWYASSESGRRVFSLHGSTNSWVAEFAYPDLAGDHMDGLEVVIDPNTGASYVYVSDMTSDFLGQYQRDRGGSWTQVNLFEYNNEQGDYVEGMGFGALNHFWMAGGSSLYEIGGGDLAKYTEPDVPPE